MALAVDRSAALRLAVLNRDAARFDKALAAVLASKESIDDGDSESINALHYAARTQQVEMVDALIAAGVDINRPTLAGSTPLEMAVRSFRRAEDPLENQAVARLLAAGVDLEAAGAKAIETAVFCDDDDALQQLLDAELAPDGGGVDIRPALETAVAAGTPRCVLRLLAVGAEANGETADSQTRQSLLHLSVRSEARRDTRHRIVRALLHYGADINARDYRCMTPLHFSAGHKNGEGVRACLALGCDLNATDAHGATPLDVAVLYGNQGVAELLCQHGGRREAPGKRAQPPPEPEPSL